MIKDNNQRQTGFTLIELMIAISILSLLLFTGAYSYSLMSERWNKELGQFSNSAKVAKSLNLLQGLLSGVSPFVVVDNQRKPSFFFIGASDSLLAASNGGLFSNNYPEIFRLTTIEKENGLVDLIYQSESTENVLLTGTGQSIEFTKKVILFSDLDNVSFSYFGWKNIFIKNTSSETGVKKKWQNSYSGIDKQLMPDSFTLVLVKDGKSLSFPIVLEENSEHWLSPYFDSAG